MNFNETYELWIFKIAEMLKEELNVKGELLFSTIAKHEAVRYPLTETYRILCKRGVCQPIERITEEQKQQLWGEAKRLCPNGNRTKLIAICKALQGLGAYCQL